MTAPTTILYAAYDMDSVFAVKYARTTYVQGPWRDSTARDTTKGLLQRQRTNGDVFETEDACRAQLEAGQVIFRFEIPTAYIRSVRQQTRRVDTSDGLWIYRLAA